MKHFVRPLSTLLTSCLFFLFAHAFPRALPIPQGQDGSGSRELIGDLRTVGPTTPVGRSIANIIMGSESGQSSVIGQRPANDTACAADPCCVWYDVSLALTVLFLGPAGRCNNQARAAIRLGFHDAGTWSKTNRDSGLDFGGADGSLLMNFGEDARAENNGLQGIIGKLRIVQKLFKIGFADLVQYASIHAVVTCPLGPRLRAFTGRKDATRAAPDGLLPDVHAAADSLIALFQDKTIVPHDLAALLGAHSTSKAFVQPGVPAGTPQDTTPAVWDVRFYNETIQSPSPKGVFVFPSDAVLSKHPAVSTEWNSFIDAQSHWNEDYATAYTRLSMLGVNNINSLRECSQTLPPARPDFPGASVQFADS
ncbi:hypothetical protein LTR66_009604 [Elasticomyces elasticus]|nr:hypothetical protein LTR66_009604 [Elasticomyces elasticus]KAK4987394.1 hypothetical protein LTR50_004631 [Elasticomyces elasticus]